MRVQRRIARLRFQPERDGLDPHSAFRIPQFRKGLSLAEVLIALLVLSLGMMGILALYPLGAKQMADAIKDERAAQLANTGEGLMRLYWRSAYLNSDGSSVKTDAQVMVTNPELGHLDNPGYFDGSKFGLPPDYVGGWTPPPPPVPPTAPPNPWTLSPAAPYQANASGPSSPLLIDPIGWSTFGAGNSYQGWVGGLNVTAQYPNGVLPRQGVGWINQLRNRHPRAGTAATIRFASLLDDLIFDNQGLAAPPANPSAPIYGRGYGFNAAYLIQRAKNNVRHQANLKVIVYKGRPPSDTPASETPFHPPPSPPAPVLPVQFANQFLITPPSPSVGYADGTIIRVQATGLPPLRKGSWILVASQSQGSLPALGNGNLPYQPAAQVPVEPFADFYRVVTTALDPADATKNTLVLTVSPSIRSHVSGPGNNIYASYAAQSVMILENVVEVFDRGTLTPFALPAN